VLLGIFSKRAVRRREDRDALRAVERVDQVGLLHGTDEGLDSTGLPEAAVATGTLAMAAKLPGFDASVGTAAQPAPNWSPAAMAEPEGDIDGAIGAAAGADGAGSRCHGRAAPPPQAVSETVAAAAAAATANLRVRMGKPFQEGTASIGSTR
jgi:hypothetical protein